MPHVRARKHFAFVTALSRRYRLFKHAAQRTSKAIGSVLWSAFLVLAGNVVVVILVSCAFSLFFGGSKENVKDLKAIPAAKVFLGNFSIDHDCYQYWKYVHEPSEAEFFSERAFPRTTSWPLSSIGEVTDRDFKWYGAVPYAYHLWGKNIIRSAKARHTDIVIVLSELCSDFRIFAREIRQRLGRSIIFIAFGDNQSEWNVHVLELGLYVIGKTHMSTDPVVDQDQRLGLIEIADLYVSFDNRFAKVAGCVETPTIVAYSQRNFLPGYNVSFANTRGSVHVQDLIDLSTEILSRPKIDLIFHSYIDPTMGYGSSAEHMALALERHGLSIRFQPISRMQPSEWKSFLKPATLRMLERREMSDHYLTYIVPHEWETKHLHRTARKARVTMVYTTFETTKIPLNWPTYINRYDRLLVSCEAMKKVFARCGVKIPIDVVPLGVYPPDWPLLERNVWSPFRFLLYADGEWTNHRKNYELVYDTFVKGFKDDLGVELLLKLTRIDEDIAKIEADLPLNVRIYKGRFNQQKLLQLMSQANALVFPSKGEGFGLPPREAMSTGIPAIFAGFGGLESIAREDIAYPLKWSLSKADGYDFWMSENGDSDDFGEWASPDPHSLLARMKEAASFPEQARQKGLAASQYIREHETYDVTGRLIIESLASASPAPLCRQEHFFIPDLPPQKLRR